MREIRLMLRLSVVLVMMRAAPAAAQDMTVPPPLTHTVELAGPRFGFTMLTQGVVDALAERRIQIKPVISQFGWQVEKQFYSHASGVTAVTEFVGLLGGLEQGVALPSGNWLVGLRSREGAEFGIGPNISPAGVGLVIAAGVTFRAGALNVPMNFALVPSKDGVRVSVLTGFTLRRR
ncbi:MAG: hypothetical protein ABI051_15385 [Vicinamibacterales bacterium]